MKLIGLLFVLKMGDLTRLLRLNSKLLKQKNPPKLRGIDVL